MSNFTKKLIVAGFIGCSVIPASSQVRSRTANAAPMTPEKEIKGAPYFKAITNPLEYGTEVVTLNEDFSKFSTGTEDAPDFDANINFQNPDGIVWINVLNEYTTMPGWGAHNAFPAGGKLFLNVVPKQEQGHVNTPMLDVSGYQGICFISFKARVPNGSQPASFALVEAAETFNMAPSWRNMGSFQLPEVTTEWKTFTYMFYGGGKYTIFNIVAMDASLLIDDVKVFQINQYAATPTAYNHKNYKGEANEDAQFDLRWSKVTNADSYIINVYSKDETGNITNYLLKDFSNTDTTYTVTGAHSGDIYYYTVSSKVGSHVSIPSQEVEIKDVASPFLKPVTEIKDGKYTASWDSVPSAERYNYISYYTRTADQAGEFTISDLNLVGLKYSNGKEVEFSIDNKDTHTFDQGVIDGMSQAGWIAKSYAIYKDALTFDAFQYLYNHQDAGLISPELDLSKDNGKIKINLTACGEECSYYDNNNVEHKGYTQCAVALFNYNAEKGDYEQSELIYPGEVKGTWQDFSCQLTTGTKRSIIGFYGVSYPGNLYLSKIKIAQDYKAGETFNDPFFYVRWLDKKSIEVNVPYKANQKDIYHRAQSVRVSKVSQQSISRLESPFSELQYVGKAVVSGISNTKANISGATVRLEGNSIVVDNPGKENIYVYNLTGAIVYSNTSRAASTTLPTFGHGVFLVKVGKQTIKLTM